MTKLKGRRLQQDNSIRLVMLPLAAAIYFTFIPSAWALHPQPQIYSPKPDNEPIRQEQCGHALDFSNPSTPADIEIRLVSSRVTSEVCVFSEALLKDDNYSLDNTIEHLALKVDLNDNWTPESMAWLNNGYASHGLSGKDVTFNDLNQSQHQTMAMPAMV